MTDQKKRLILNTAILTATTLVIRAISMGFNAWLSVRIGSAGVGLFQIMMSVYRMAVTLAVSGMRLASTRLCSEALARGESPRRVLAACTRVSGAMGLVATALLFMFSDLAAGMLTHPEAAYPLRVLSLTLPLIAVDTVLSGYITARRRMPVSGALSIVEQLLRVGLTAAALYVLPGGPDYAILAVAMGMIGSDILSFGVTFAYCLFDLRKVEATPAEPGLLANIRRIALPDALGSWIRSALSTAEQMLVPGSLSKASPEGNALATYGMIQGMAMPVIGFPGAPMHALAGLLIPEISQMRVLGQGRTIKRTVRRAVSLSLAYSSIVAVLIFIGADMIASGLYKNPDAAAYIRLLAPLALFMYTDALVDQMLKSLDQQAYCMRLNTVDCVLRLLLVLFLLPLGGVRAYILMLYISAAFNSSLSLLRLLRVSRTPRLTEPPLFDILRRGGVDLYKAAIFDLDGTLLDTLRDLAEAGNYALKARGLNPYPIEAYKKMVGKGIPYLIEQMTQGRDARTAQDVKSVFEAYYAKHMADHTAPYPGIMDMLERLKANGLRMAVLSNKADEFLKPIVGKYFPNIFDEAIGLKEGFPAKPDPASAMYLAELLGAGKTNTLYVGDSGVDMLTARAAGLPSCGVLWGFRDRRELKAAGARFIAENVGELEGLLT